jgi:hypothetical protein
MRDTLTFIRSLPYLQPLPVDSRQSGHSRDQFDDGAKDDVISRLYPNISAPPPCYPTKGEVP